MKPYNLQIKVRNNLLLNAIRESGYRTVNEFCKKNNLYPTDIGRYVNFKLAPYTLDRRDGRIIKRKTAEKLSFILGKDINELFPRDHLYEPLAKNVAETTLDRKDVEALCMGVSPLSPEESLMQKERVKILNDILGTLPSKEREVMRLRFNGDLYLGEIAEMLGLSKERVRQIEKSAINKLRSSYSRKLLNDVVDFA